MIEMYGWEPEYAVYGCGCPGGRKVEAPGEAVSGHGRILEEMAGSIRRGEANYDRAQQALAALEVVRAAFMSGATDSTVKLPLAGDDGEIGGPEFWPGKPVAGEGGAG
jgi:hypothetical protein